jgi:hypothetical protein
MKKVYILIVLFFTSIISYGQYLKADIALKDGTIKHGFIKKMKFDTDAILLKTTKKDKEPIKIDQKKIEKIILFNKKDESISYEYYYLPVDRYLGKMAIKMEQKSIWVQLRMEGYVSLFQFSKKSSFYDNNISMSRGVSQIVYYAIRKGEKVAINIGINTMNGYYLKRDGAKYFADYPELSEKLKKKKKGYKIKDIIQIVDEYNAWVNRNK